MPSSLSSHSCGQTRGPAEVAVSWGGAPSDSEYPTHSTSCSPGHRGSARSHDRQWQKVCFCASFTSCHCRSRFLAVIIPARRAPLEGAGLSPAARLRPPRQAAKPGVNLGVGSLCPAPSLLILIPEWNIFGACFLPYPRLCGTCWELAGYSWRSGFVERLLPPPPPCRVVAGEMYAAHKKDCRFMGRLCGLRRWHFSIQRGD